MKTILSWEEYEETVSSLKAPRNGFITNTMVTKQSIERYMKQRRFLVDTFSDGIIFFKDEKEFYDLVFFWNKDAVLPKLAMKKPCVIRRMERVGQESETKKWMEKNFPNIGFCIANEYINVQGDPKELLKNLNTVAPKAETFLERFGIEIVSPDHEMIKKIRMMQYEIRNIPFYDIDYYSDEELLEDSQKGYLLAAVDKRNGKLCGANHSVIMGKYVTGWLAVRDEYINIPGIGICLHKKAMERDLLSGHLKRTWIAKNNKESQEYHKRIGYLPTGAEMSVWLMDKNI